MSGPVGPGDRRGLHSLVVVKPGSMGDVIHALPVAAAVKAAYPACRLGWVIDTRWRALLDGNPDIDRVMEFPREKFRGWHTVSAVGWAAGLWRESPEVALDLQGLMRSALIARAMRPGRVVGMSDAREGGRWLCNEVVEVDRQVHSVHRYLSSLRPLGIPIPEVPVFRIPEGRLVDGLAGSGFVVVHPFARGAGKSLDRPALVALLEGLAPLPVVLVGASADAPSMPHVQDLLGKTSLEELIGILRAARYVVSVDSGPAHLADALGAPLLAIHTWSNPGSVGPFSKQALVWQGGVILPAQMARRAVVAEPGPDDARVIARSVQDELGRGRGKFFSEGGSL